MYEFELLKRKRYHVFEFAVGDIFLHTRFPDFFVIVSVYKDYENSDGKFTAISLLTGRQGVLYGRDELASGYKVFRDKELIAYTD